LIFLFERCFFLFSFFFFFSFFSTRLPMRPAPQERISVWLLKKGDRGVVRTWKKRFFQGFGRNEDVEICYFTSADSEKQGSIELKSVLEIKIVDDELHVISKNGRVYILKVVNNSHDDLSRLWAHWQSWLAYVRSFLSASEVKAEKRRPSLSLPLATLEGMDTTEQCQAPDVSSAQPPKKDSPRKEGMSPRKLVAEVRQRFGTGARASKLEAELEHAVEEEGGEIALALQFSLLQSLQPMMLLYFVLNESKLVGYADESRTEEVEVIPLEAIVRALATGETRFELWLRNGERLFFGGQRTAVSFVKALQQRMTPEELEVLEEPEIGSCDLHLDVAEEIHVNRRASATLAKHLSFGALNHQPDGETQLLPFNSLVSNPLSSNAQQEVLACPICATLNVVSVDRCVECGSSDGYSKRSSSPAVGAGAGATTPPHSAPPIPAKPRLRPVPPPPSSIPSSVHK
jgi:hypothetical protein